MAFLIVEDLEGVTRRPDKDLSVLAVTKATESVTKRPHFLSELLT